MINKFLFAALFTVSSVAMADNNAVPAATPAAVHTDVASSGGAHHEGQAPAKHHEDHAHAAHHKGHAHGKGHTKDHAHGKKGHKSPKKHAAKAAHSTVHVDSHHDSHGAEASHAAPGLSAPAK